MERLSNTYRRLDDILPTELPQSVLAWVARCRDAGITAATRSGAFDPVAEYGGPTELDRLDPAEREHWAPVMAAAGRPTYTMPDVYPAELILDEGLPLEVALEDDEATGNTTAYLRALKSIVDAEPRDIDAHVHLGNLYLDLADNRRKRSGPDGRRARVEFVQSALECYLVAVAVGELALPEPFTGLLLWGDFDNRPFLRAQHGLALASWDLELTPVTRAVLANMLYLNPLDNQGAGVILADMANGVTRAQVRGA